MSTLGAFDRSTLGEFLRSPLGERGPNVPSPILVPTTSWFVNSSGVAFYIRTDNPLSTFKSDNVFSAGAGSTLPVRMYLTTDYNLERHFRVNYNNINTGIQNPNIATPISIDWTVFITSIVGSILTETLNIYAVKRNTNSLDATNYRNPSLISLLASIPRAGITPNAFNTFSLDVTQFINTIIDNTWGLFLMCGSDANSVDPGLTPFPSINYDTGFVIPMNSNTFSNKPEYIKFTY